jgi:DNA-binding beta-propeller fold protein YncE
MVKSTLSAVIVPVIIASVGACTGAGPINSVGRPCSVDQQCGPGTYCDHSTLTCVAQRADATVDITRADGPTVDTMPVDTLPVDSFPIPDGGCPTGYTACGSTCVQLSSEVKHCGACFNACPSEVSDSCVNSKCVCGGTGNACSGGLNCSKGTCECVVGGLCNGCCDGNACLPVGTPQSLSKCGAGGTTCKNCADTSECTDDSCLGSGACQNSPRPDNTSCNDGLDCTHTDRCQTGVCKGTAYTCSDGLSCTTDTCTGNPPPNLCDFDLTKGNCLIQGNCYASGATNPSDGCEQCLSSEQTTSWSLASGCVSTLAGTGTAGFNNGPAASAKFDTPIWVVVDSNSGKAYVADSDNHRIRVISGGTVSTFAGTGTAGFKDGAANSAMFNWPAVMVLDSSGKLYVSDVGNHSIRVISGGVVSTFAGTGTAGFNNGPLSQAQFNEPAGMVFDGAGKLYLTDAGNHRIRVISGGTVSSFAGTGVAGFQDGALGSAKFNYPVGIARDSSGKLYLADADNHRIRVISGGTVSTLAGTGVGGYQNGQATSARFNFPVGIALDSSGMVYVGDSDNHRIRMISAGTVSTFAGGWSSGFQDGPLNQARFNNPNGLTLADGLFYVADGENNAVRVIKP